MATFPSIDPSYNLSKKSAPKVRTAQFGSGYSQRSIFGINQNLKVLDLRWENIPEADADTIETFLDARSGSENFDFTAPGESSSSKYICKEWNKNIPYSGIATITASFEQVAEA
jgi:phage-related protein